jgi:hypothetical protein
MITGLEEAVAAVIEAALAEDDTIAAVPYVVVPATTREEVPGNKTIVAVRLSQGDRTMVELIDAIAEIIVGTPAKSESTSIASHKLMEQAVDRVFSPGAMIGEVTIKAALSTAIAAKVDGYLGGGFFNQGWQPGREDTSWVPYLAVKIGAVRE